MSNTQIIMSGDYIHSGLAGSGCGTPPSPEEIRRTFLAGQEMLTKIASHFPQDEQAWRDALASLNPHH